MRRKQALYEVLALKKFEESEATEHLINSFNKLTRVTRSGFDSISKLFVARRNTSLILINENDPFSESKDD